MSALYKVAHCETADVFLAHCPHCGRVETVFRAGVSTALLVCGDGCHKTAAILTEKGEYIVACPGCGEPFKIPKAMICPKEG